MQASMKFGNFESDTLDAAFEEALREYISVKVRDISPDKRLPCDLFFPSYNRTEKRIDLLPIMLVGQVCERDFLETMKTEEIEEVYIKQEDEDAFQQYFNLNLRKILQTTTVPSHIKTELLYDNAVNIVKRVFREHPNEANLQLGRTLVLNFATHVLVDDVTSETLFALFAKDYYTFSHCVQVALLGMTFCKFLGWSGDEISDFGMGALFHDVGKNAIDDKTLNKRGPLKGDEFELIRQHPSVGYQQLEHTQAMTPEQLSVVLQHHEAMDGTGYPNRARGSQIHKYARVARIVDIFDALTTKRAYKDAMPPSEALRILQTEMGHSLDEQLLESFIRFVTADEPQADSDRGLRVQLKLGAQLQLQVEDGGARLKSTFLGLEGEKYLILKVPAHSQVFDQLKQGKQVIIRYISDGSVYGFRTQIIAQITYPFPIVFLVYPKTIENVSLRKEPRAECQLAAELLVDDRPFHGFILDLTTQGCKFLLRSTSSVPVPALELSQPVTIRASVPGQTEMNAFPGIIRNLKHDQDKLFLGIQFGDLADEAMFPLKKYLAEHQRPGAS